MRLILTRLTRRERLDFFIHSFEWLVDIKIPVHHEDGTWTYELYSIREMIGCFLGELETVVLGYVWRCDFDDEKC
jgi:hypothetical protein